MKTDDLTVRLSGELVDAVARRTAEILIAEFAEELRPASGRWLRTREAVEYLGLRRGALYSRIGQIPHYRFERMLLFKREELDAWVEGHRVEPAVGWGARMGSAAGRSAPAPIGRQEGAGSRAPRGRLSAELAEPERESKPRRKRERPLPDPLGASEQQKDEWAHQLEISRVQLDDMSPGEFKRAWDARNQRLRDAGVFDHLEELAERLGYDELFARTASELIAELGQLRGESL